MDRARWKVRKNYTDELEMDFRFLSREQARMAGTVCVHLIRAGQ